MKRIKILEKNIMEDKKNINDLIDLLSYLEDNDPKVVLKCIRSIQNIFQYLIKNYSLIYQKSNSTENKYLEWLQERYNDTVQLLLQKFSHEIFDIPNFSIVVLMQFIKAEVLDKQKKNINNILITRMIETLLLLSKTDHSENLIFKFCEYLKFDDIRYSSLKCLHKLIDQENYCYNNSLAFLLLKNLHSPKKSKSENSTNTMRNYFTLTIDNEKDLLNNNFEKEQQKLFGDIWIKFIKINHSSDLNKLIIGCLGDKVMPYMSCPLSLADILTNAYNAGGSLSLLALNGIFILINDYNLQYPDFYGKLYTIVKPNVLSEKYRARFFYLLDLFLSSTHLPAYLVCAFIKRLSRLSLKCPTAAIFVINAMITNLLVRHPSCQFLVNTTSQNNSENLENDLYIEDENDPAKCNASQSSLWELQTMQSHFHHSVATEMQGLNEQLPLKQIQIKHLFDLTYDNLFEKERKKKIKTIPTNFNAPEGFQTIFDKQIILFN